MVRKSTTIGYPPPSTSPQVSLRTSPVSTVGSTRTSSRIPHGRRPCPSVLRICAGHRSAAKDRDDRVFPKFRLPHRVHEEGPHPAFPLVRGPFSTWWQVKDSNLRSFRDGFTVPRLQTFDQRKRLSRNNFHAYSPQIADDRQQQPDTQRTMRHLRIVPPHRAPHLRPWSSPSRRRARSEGQPANGPEVVNRSRAVGSSTIGSLSHGGVERFRYWRVGRGSGSGWAVAALASVWLTCSRKTVTSGARRATPPCSKA